MGHPLRQASLEPREIFKMAYAKPHQRMEHRSRPLIDRVLNLVGTTN